MLSIKWKFNKDSNIEMQLRSDIDVKPQRGNLHYKETSCTKISSQTSENNI